jgi:hypothetical protein
MPVYAKTVYPKYPIDWEGGLALSLNIALLAIVYTSLGAILSFFFYYIFDEHVEDWEKKGLLYQVYDLFVEVAIIGITSFWVVYIVNERFPIIPVRKDLAPFIDTYSTGLFFMYTIFIFVDSFGSKLIYVINHLFGSLFDKYLPDSGSILDGSLRWSRKN